MAGHSSRDVVISAPLCFLFSKFGKISSHKLIQVICDSFELLEITKAKELLARDCEKIKSDRPLPRLVTRRDKDSAKRARQEVIDIEFMVSALDRRKLLGQLPIYVTDNTDSVPTLKLEDGELRYLMQKVDKLEDMLLCTQQTVNKLYSILSTVLTDEVDRARQQGITLTHSDHVTRLLNELGGATDQSAAHSRPLHDVTTTPGTTHRRDWASSVSANVLDSQGETQNEQDTETDAVAAAGGDDEEDDDDSYTLVGRNKRRRNRSNLQFEKKEKPKRDNQFDEPKKTFAAAVRQPKKPGRKPLIIGEQRSPKAGNYSVNNTLSFSAAKPLVKAFFCVDNVNPTVTSEQIITFVKRLSARVISCNEAKPRRTFTEVRDDIFPTDRKAFRLCINKADTQLLLDPSKWPSDIAISEWYFKPKISVTDAGRSNAVSDVLSAVARSNTIQQNTTPTATDTAAPPVDSDLTPTEQFTDAMGSSPTAEVTGDIGDAEQTVLYDHVITSQQ